jgi:hypothetical protein
MEEEHGSLGPGNWGVSLMEGVLEEWESLGVVEELPGRWRRNMGPWGTEGRVGGRVPLGEGVLEELGSLNDGDGTRVIGDREESWRKGSHWRRVLEELGSLDDGGGTQVLGDWEKGCHWRRGEFMDLNPLGGNGGFELPWGWSRGCLGKRAGGIGACWGAGEGGEEIGTWQRNRGP